jgi:protein-S-isoprenylcysteine O-methyltransferase Ste14
VRLSLSSTSTRTFLLWPVCVAVEQCLARRRVRPGWLLLLAWGYGQYRLSGAYRTRIGGGGPGMSKPPEALVTSGIYAHTRNPMYLGHQIALAGLALATRSPLAAALFAGHLPWFDARAGEDEAALRARFGGPYERYRRQVPRWFPRPARLSPVRKNG